MLRHVVSCFLMMLIWAILLVWLAFSYSADPSGPIVVALTVGCLVVFLPFPSRQRSLKDALISIAIYAIFSGGVAAIREAPSTRYNIAYSSIRIGMTLDELEEVVRRELPYRISSTQSDVVSGHICLEPIDPNYNAEVINVSVHNGRVSVIWAIPD